MGPPDLVNRYPPVIKGRRALLQLPLFLLFSTFPLLSSLFCHFPHPKRHLTAGCGAFVLQRGPLSAVMMFFFLGRGCCGVSFVLTPLGPGRRRFSLSYKIIQLYVFWWSAGWDRVLLRKCVGLSAWDLVDWLNPCCGDGKEMGCLFYLRFTPPSHNSPNHMFLVFKVRIGIICLFRSKFTFIF